MKLVVLGTGAGESYPGLWCTCRNCTYARTHGGKNIRANSSVLIDDRLMIDMPESALRNAIQYGRSLASVKTLLVTHPHIDHFAPNHLWERNYPTAFKGMAEDELFEKRGAPCTAPLPELQIYGTRFVREAIERAEDLEQPWHEYHFAFHEVSGGMKFTADGYLVTALAARHGPEGYTVNYILEKDGVCLLYATDTGGYSEQAYRELYLHQYHGVIVEATCGNTPLPDMAGHMNLEHAERFLQELRDHGCITGQSQLWLTHLSPHWTPPHDKLAPQMEQKGIGVAYDGQVIEIQG